MKISKRIKLFSLLLFIVSISSLGNCDAQSITGKWKEVSMKNYYTAQEAKESGEKFTEHPPYTEAQVLVIKADHSFTTNQWMSWIPGTLQLTGTWSLAGNQLKTKLDTRQMDPRNNPTPEAALNIYTLTVTADHLILSMPVLNNPIMEKMEKTYVKM
jgi:hypothetical protein